MGGDGWGSPGSRSTPALHCTETTPVVFPMGKQMWPHLLGVFPGQGRHPGFKGTKSFILCVIPGQALPDLGARKLGASNAVHLADT